MQRDPGEAMVSGRLLPQAIISFTSDGEDESRGADQTIDYLDRGGLFENLEMVLTLDLTEKVFGRAHFSIENYLEALSRLARGIADDLAGRRPGRHRHG